MIEMAVKSFTDFDGNFTPLIAADGSCHTFRKDLHIFDADRLAYHTVHEDCKITTSIYPWSNNHLEQVLAIVSEKFSTWQTDKKILVHAPNQMWAEINMLFQYHKIAQGSGKTLEIFGGNANRLDIQKWDKTYQHWSEMQTWQYREWLSLFYPGWIKEWIESPSLVSDDFLILSNQDIIEFTLPTLQKIFDHCGVKPVKPFLEFCQDYVAKQTYVLEEYQLIDCIADHIIKNQPLSWPKISVIAEAILQHKFLQQGYGWYCDGLNHLPNNSQDFQKIIFHTT